MLLDLTFFGRCPAWLAKTPAGRPLAATDAAARQAALQAVGTLIAAWLGSAHRRAE